MRAKVSQEPARRDSRADRPRQIDTDAGQPHRRRQFVLAHQFGVVALQAGIISAVPMPGQQQPDRGQPEQGEHRQQHGHRRHPELHPEQIAALVDDVDQGTGWQRRKNIGREPATCTRATFIGLAESEVISQTAPTSCIQVPMLEAMLASHSQRKVFWCSRLQGEVTGMVMLEPAFERVFEDQV